jgi:hypothetical protein
MYNLAPKSVIDGLSQHSKDIVERRIINGEFKTYVPLGYHLRIRGLKPSILYTKYTTLRDDNTVESMYVMSAEEIQCIWVKEIQKKTSTIPQVDQFINAMSEMPWCIWEDKFMSNNISIPEQHLHGYVDIAKNTFTHCIAYACTNKQPIDLNQIEDQFQAAKFSTNEDMFKVNDLGETPLKILSHNEELLVFVESLLLRLPAENRLKALPFQNWSNSWGSLIHSTVMNETLLLIQQTRKLEGFLSIFFHLTHNSDEAIQQLFLRNYQIQPWHIYRDKLKNQQKQMIKETIIKIPSWHNLTIWLYFIKINNNPNLHFTKMKSYLNHRIQIIKEELIIKIMSPEYFYWNHATMLTD